ncbi:MAG: hypothetical protein BVN28_14630, partial [Nitrospira sp. ST-bin4]
MIPAIRLVLQLQSHRSARDKITSNRIDQACHSIGFAVQWTGSQEDGRVSIASFTHQPLVLGQELVSIQEV